MAKFRSPKTSFIAGQISPTAFGRTDIPQYASACKTLKNMIPFLTGGAYRRPGTKYEGEFLDTTDYPPAIYPFVFSQGDAFIIVFGKSRISDTPYVGCLIPDQFSNAGSPSTVRLFDSGTSPYVSPTEYHNLQFAQSADVVWFVNPYQPPQKVFRQVTGAGTQYKIADFDTSSTGGALTGAAIRDAVPYRAQNSAAINMYTTALSGATTAFTDVDFFDATHVGALFKIKMGGTIGCFRVTGYTNPRQVSVTYLVNTAAFGLANQTLQWWESAWSDYRGWPRAIGFFQQRLCYAGTKAQPDTIWFSQTSNYGVLSVETVANPDDDVYYATHNEAPFSRTLSSRQLNEIQWLSSEQQLIVGTSGSEWVVGTVSNATAGFGPQTAVAYTRTSYGSAHKQAVRAGNEVIHVSADGTEARALVFNDTESSYVSEPVQLLFDDYPRARNNYATVESGMNSFLGERGYRSMAWDESRKTVWFLDTAGNLLGLTRDRKLQMSTWHTHELGGYDEDIICGSMNMPTGSVISMTVAPNTITRCNDVWLVVQRKINGVVHYHIERMIGKYVPVESAYTPILGYTGNYYTDCSTAASNSILGDPPLPGFDVPLYTIEMPQLPGYEAKGVAGNSNGYFEIDFYAPGTNGTGAGFARLQAPYPTEYATRETLITAGIPFKSVVVPVRIEAGSIIGSAQGAVKRVHEATFRLYKTLSCSVGGDADNLEELSFVTDDLANTNKAPEFFTGDKRVKLDCDYDRDGYIYIESERALPFAVISLIAEGVTYD